jgi:hypothetical protein
VAAPDPFPSFRDRFLEGVARAVERRRKAISYHGGLTVTSGFEEGVEWLTLVRSSFDEPVLVVELFAGNRGYVCLRNNRPRRRGKVLVRLEGLRLVDNAKRFVTVFEWTAAAASRLEEGDPAIEATIGEKIAGRWHGLSVRAVR